MSSNDKDKITTITLSKPTRRGKSPTLSRASFSSGSSSGEAHRDNEMPGGKDKDMMKKKTKKKG